MTASVYARAVQKAAELVGGRAKLARLLHVPAAEIDHWIAEQAKPPREIFLRVVDLILDESGPAAEGDPPEAPPSRDAAGSSERFLD